MPDNTGNPVVLPLSTGQVPGLGSAQEGVLKEFYTPLFLIPVCYWLAITRTFCETPEHDPSSRGQHQSEVEKAMIVWTRVSLVHP